MFNRINELSTNAFVRATTMKERALPFLSYRPVGRREKISYAIGYGLMLLLIASPVFAQDGGLAGMVTSAGTQADTVKAALGKFFAVGGIIAVAGGLFNMVRKGKEGDNSHIKGSHIFVPMIGGAMFAAAGAILYKSAQSVGLQDSDVGNSSATGS